MWSVCNLHIQIFIFLFSFNICGCIAGWDEACASTCTVLDADPQLNAWFLLPKVRSYCRGSAGKILCKASTYYCNAFKCKCIVGIDRGSFILMAISLYTMPWFVWLKTSSCCTLWWLGMETSALVIEPQMCSYKALLKYAYVCTVCVLCVYMYTCIHMTVDNDPPAAMRYTEAKLSSLAYDSLLEVGSKNIVGCSIITPAHVAIYTYTWITRESSFFYTIFFYRT
jgi:hypothetical protein